MIIMPSNAVLHSEVKLLHSSEAAKPAAADAVDEGSALIPGSPDGVCVHNVVKHHRHPHPQ